MTGMKRFVSLMAVAVAIPMVQAPPALAQSGERVIIVYGDDACPTSGTGEEIVVCARKPETERYRIPEELRSSNPSPASASWASRATSIEYVGRSGTDSCSPSGAGGWTGCYADLMRKAREEKKASAAQRRAEP